MTPVKTEGEEPDVSLDPVSLEAYLASGSKQNIRIMNNIHPSHLEGWYSPSFPALTEVRIIARHILPKARTHGMTEAWGFQRSIRQNHNNGIGWQ